MVRQTQHLGKYTFEVIRQLVDDIHTVSDAELLPACASSPNA
jgi:threonine dehydratase